MPGSRLLLLLALLVALSAQAQIYTWVDANGQKHFGSQPPTPEQPLEKVEVRSAYQGSPLPPPSTPSTPSTPSAEPPASTQSGNEAASSATTTEHHALTRQTCGKALHWTGIDLPNVREIARERRRQGRIDQGQYQKAIIALEQIEKDITMEHCLASKDKDQRQYECLAQGLGILVC